MKLDVPPSSNFLIGGRSSFMDCYFVMNGNPIYLLLLESNKNEIRSMYYINIGYLEIAVFKDEGRILTF